MSKKSHNIINVITGVSVAGVTIGTMALIVVLSVFNGFEQVVTSLFNSFDPDIRITVKEGKTFDANTLPLDRIDSIPGVGESVEVVEENTLLKYKDNQQIARIKGVSDNYSRVTALDTMIVSGKMLLQQGERNFTVLGYGVAYKLGLNVAEFDEALGVYVPRRGQTQSVLLNRVFKAKKIVPSGIFSIQQEIDSEYVLLPLRFARDLLDYENQVTAIEVYLSQEAPTQKIKEKLIQMTGDDFKVKDRYQQQAVLYKIMKSEKWVTYLILTFILIIATFNIIGSLSIIMVDKKEDISFLWNLGADKPMIRKIFFIEGGLISLSGAVAGLVLGGIICWLQQAFGLVQLSTTGSFVISAYPVKMEWLDFLAVLGTVIVIGGIATFYPVWQITNRYFKDNYFKKS
ncbi:MAG: ABC transporter permease [Bacteroidales bacterium]|nr:ABC transporter permease [Bacteroidales bacterium]MCF8337371.1 ABC transporter permease [Bacteroidales bacterium]